MAFTHADFPTELVRELFDGVKGHSTLAKLAPSIPVPFSGTTEMVFTADDEASLVAEGAPKPANSGSVDPVVIRPLKFVYQLRVSDEFVKCSEERRVSYLRGFNEGFAKKIARGLDIAAMHGIDPKSGSTVASLNGKTFDSLVTNLVPYTPAAPDANISAAVAMVDDSYISGIAMSPSFSAAMANLKVNGVPQFPELRFGANPEAVAGIRSDVNSTISVGASGDMAIVGDFDAFRWGYSDGVGFEVIEYGDPDGTGHDLKQYNQVLLRGEAYIGWGILKADAFALIKNNN